MFMLKLAIAWGQPLEYVEQLDNATLLELKALNIISPFTHDVASNERAMIASLLYNQNATKKSDMRSPSELVPYIVSNTDFLEPELYKKALSQFRSIHPDSPTYQSQLEYFYQNVRDTIDFEVQQEDYDEYLIKKLRSLLP